LQLELFEKYAYWRERQKFFMKKTFFLFVKEIIIIVICAFLGVAALAVTYFIPQWKMRENVIESSIILYHEGLGAHIWESIEETMLDGYTDGLLLNVSYTETDDGLRDILLDTRVRVDGRNPMDSLYEMIALNNENYIVKNYGRYWHGYQIILRPLLCFFTYADIRQINMIVQLALVFFLVCFLERKGGEDRKLILPFLGMYIFLSPISLFSSLQFSPCFYIMLLTLIALVTLKKYLDDEKRIYIFLLAGILTAYFDLLTYPLITLGVPLIAYLCTDRECILSVKRCIKAVISYSITWGIGYVGMWAMKWIIASVFTDENVIADAMEQFLFRTGHFSKKYTYLTTLKLNLGVCNKTVLALVFLCMLLCLIVLKIRNHSRVDKRMLPGMGVAFCVTTYPYIWYFFTENHSSCHSYFTWRELGISVFGILLLLVMAMGDKKNG
jgi:hypothetical protein